MRNVTEVQYLILTQFRIFGPMHDQMLVAFLSKSYSISESGVRSRRAELVALGKLRDSGETVRLPSGRLSIVWELVP